MKSDDEMKLTAYALGELSDAERVAIESRVWSDPAARAEVEEIRGVAKLLADELAKEPTPAANPIQITKLSRPRWRGRLAIAAAVGVVVGGVAFSVMMPSLNRARETATTLRERAAPNEQEISATPGPQVQRYNAPAAHRGN